MNKIEFEEMSLVEQGVVLVSEGKHLTQINKENYLLNLYSIFDFFVEVYYSVNSNQVEKIEIMTDLSRIDLYIDESQKDENLEFTPYGFN